MSVVIPPRTVLLDSSTLVGMAADFASGDRARHDRLDGTLTFLDAGDWAPVLTLHQVAELLRHENITVARDRLRFLVALAARPRAAWMGSLQTVGLGSVVDLMAAEVEAVILGRAGLAAVIQHARTRVLRFGPGAFEGFAALEELRPILHDQMRREREIVSLMHIPTLRPSQELVGDLRRTEGSSRDQAIRHVRDSLPTLATELKRTGERRLQEPADVALTFARDLTSKFPRAHPGVSAVDAILAHFGVDPAEVPDNMTFRDACYLAVFRAKLTAAGSVLGISGAELKAVTPGQLPSWSIQQALRIRQLGSERPAAGDLADSYLAAFAPYVDHAIVDRRTHEYLRQAERTTELAGARLVYSKLADYSELIAVLT